MVDDFLRQQINSDIALLQECNGMTYCVLKLTHIARPVVDLKSPDGIGGDGRERLGVLQLLADEVAGERNDVLGTLPERRDIKGNHGKPVVKVAAERPLHHGLLQIRVGGGDHTHIHGDILGAAHAPYLTLLKHAEQLTLKDQRHG